MRTWDRLELCVITAAALGFKASSYLSGACLGKRSYSIIRKSCETRRFRTWHRVAGALDREKGQIVRRRGVAPALIVRDSLLQAARGNTRVPATTSPATLVFKTLDVAVTDR